MLTALRAAPPLFTLRGLGAMVGRALGEKLALARGAYCGVEGLRW
jgi:hypothetical protein